MNRIVDTIQIAIESNCDLIPHITGSVAVQRTTLIRIQRVYIVHVGLFVIMSRKSRSRGFRRFSYRRPLGDQISLRWPRKNVSYDSERNGSDSGSGKKVLMTFTTSWECCSSQSNATLCPVPRVHYYISHRVVSSARQMLTENCVIYFVRRLVEKILKNIW